MATERSKNDKQGLLANLYSLRAGISLACIIKDKADTIISNAKEKRKKLIEQSQVALNGASNQSAQLQSEAKSKQDRIEEIEGEVLDDLRVQARYKRKKMKTDFIFSLIIIAIFAILLIMAYSIFYFLTGAGVFGYAIKSGSILDKLYGWMYIWEADPNYVGSTSPMRKYGVAGFLDIVSWVVVLAGIAGIIFLILEAQSRNIDRRKNNNEYNHWKYEIDKLALERATLLNEVEQAGDTHEDTQSLVAEKERELERVKAETTAMLDKAVAEAKPYVETVLAIVTALDNTFTDILDIRDWENLDYIIYCIETRRCDNVKEALEAVDRQRQTEQIMTAVENAGKEICRTLNSAMAKLETKMVQCFSTISTQLARQSRQLSAIAGKLDDVITEQSMSNALLTMQNVTSMAMLGELNKISNATSYVASCVSLA